MTAPGRPDNGHDEGRELWPTYYCPTSGQDEHAQRGGFDVCCDRPDLHRPAVADDQRREARRLVERYEDDGWDLDDQSRAAELLSLLGQDGSETDGGERQHRMDGDCWCGPVDVGENAWEHR